MWPCQPAIDKAGSATQVAGHSCQHVEESVTAMSFECFLDDVVKLMGVGKARNLYRVLLIKLLLSEIIICIFPKMQFHLLN
jgi:hypothetical protein